MKEKKEKLVVFEHPTGTKYYVLKSVLKDLESTLVDKDKIAQELDRQIQEGWK